MVSSNRVAAQFTDQQAEEIARLAEDEGWQVAAHDYMRLVNHRAYRLAVDDYRGQVSCLLPIGPSSRVLQLGADWGPVAFNLAAAAGVVYAADARGTRVRYLAARKGQEEVENLQVVQTACVSALPFADGAFDAVVALDPLKAAAGSGERGSCRAILKEIKRVLVPGGWLLLGVGNRLGLGRRSSDSGLVRTYWSHLAAMRVAGFGAVSFFAPLPSIQEPFFLLPLGRRQPIVHFVDSIVEAEDYRAKAAERGLLPLFKLALTGWRAGRRLGMASLVRFLVPGYLVVGRA